MEVDPNTPLILSVSGMRGLVGKSLTPTVATRYGAAVGTWLKRTRDKDHPKIVVGRDSRPSGLMYESAAIAGLTAVGCEVVQVGILSTPGIAVMVGELNADGGLVITASHNPAPWNGMKALRYDGVAPPPEQVEQLLEDFHHDAFAYVGTPDIQPVDRDDRGVDIHVKRLLDAGINVEGIRNAKLHAVVDSTRGAGGAEAAALLQALGVEFTHLYPEPTGDFPHPPEPTKDNLTELADAVAKHRAHVGFAQDTDADRLAIVDEGGRYIGEEYTLALCGLHGLTSGDTIAANLSTSRMIDDVADAAGAQVVRSAVGEANVAAAMRKHGARLGGEGNGGIIWSAISQVRDSLVGMALVLELLAHRQSKLSEIVATIPTYTIVKEKIAVPEGDMTPLLRRVADAIPEAAVNREDGVRLDVGQTWVHVRASNTEPILRIIAEAPTKAEADALIATVREVL
ncbi:MAG: phosphoglucosamine mutase [Planctomycetota bacterium]